MIDLLHGFSNAFSFVAACMLLASWLPVLKKSPRYLFLCSTMLFVAAILRITEISVEWSPVKAASALLWIFLGLALAFMSEIGTKTD